MEPNNTALYRIFSIQCSRDRLIDLSSWLNANLDFSAGEDFNKISDSPLEADVDTTICKTSRQQIAQLLTWAAQYVTAHPDGKAQSVDKARRMCLLAAKITKSVNNG